MGGRRGFVPAKFASFLIYEYLVCHCSFLSLSSDLIRQRLTQRLLHTQIKKHPQTFQSASVRSPSAAV